MRGFFKDFLYFTKTERRGILVLFVLCFLLFATWRLLPLIYPQESYDFTAFQQEIEASYDQDKQDQAQLVSTKSTLFYFNPNQVSKQELEDLGLSAATIRSWQNYLTKGGRFHSASDLKNFRKLPQADYDRIIPYAQFDAPQIKNSQKPTVMLSSFDPNLIQEEGLKQMGLPNHTVQAWLKYRAKGGIFRTKADLANFRALAAVDLERIAPFLVFAEVKEEETPQASYSQVRETEKSSLVIDINQASQENWQDLYGIGPKLSQRIIKFRDALGGFSHLDQVGETYGLPDSTFQSIKPQLRLSSIFRRLEVNKLSKKELAQHPYLDYKTAGLIVNYRKQHGPFQDVDALKKIKVLSTELIDKLHPYLVFK